MQRPVAISRILEPENGRYTGRVVHVIGVLSIWILLAKVTGNHRRYASGIQSFYKENYISLILILAYILNKLFCGRLSEGRSAWLALKEVGTYSKKQRRGDSDLPAVLEINL